MINKIRDELIDLPMTRTTLLQFVDDTAIVTPAHAKNIKLIMATLETFAQVSGLKINLSKSGFLPIEIPLDLVHTVASLLKFNPLTFPIQYLGLPLTINKPPKSAYLPLLANVQRRCEGFKGKNLSMAGRLILANSILNAVPLHYMQAFILPKCIIKQITNTTRRFLWRGNKETYSSGHCLVAWTKITLSKNNGGLGIMDLQLQNKALLLKWIWLPDCGHQCLWTKTLHNLQIPCTTSAVENDNRLSFFMRDLTTLNTYYNASVHHQQDGTPNWRWNATFTLQSVYLMYNNPGIIQTELSCLWDLKAPNKIKIFL
jgi:hypothetical protein